MSKRIHVVMPDELVARIDAALADGQSRGHYIRRAVERALNQPTRHANDSSRQATPPRSPK
jgi:Arc/MetJ-type ribon-helix-helix transcriptional regulator